MERKHTPWADKIIAENADRYATIKLENSLLTVIFELPTLRDECSKLGILFPTEEITTACAKLAKYLLEEKEKK